jgi:hypothetical protein
MIAARRAYLHIDIEHTSLTLARIAFVIHVSEDLKRSKSESLDFLAFRHRVLSCSSWASSHPPS